MNIKEQIHEQIVGIKEHEFTVTISPETEDNIRNKNTLYCKNLN